MPTVSGRIVFDINRNANIGGNITGINNLPVALQNVDTLTALVVLTNVMGDYSFINVPTGNYRLIEAYGLIGGIPTPGDFNTAAVLPVITSHTPPVGAVTAVPPGATNIDCVTPNTILITVAAADVLNQYIFNGAVRYTPLNLSLDPCVSVLPANLVLDADGGTLGGFPAGTTANTGPAADPYPALFPDFTYVVPNPATYTPIDGQFTVQNTMNDAMSNVVGAWWRISDHTTGNETGRMMIVNENDPGDIIFRTTVAVSPNKTYLFSTWILNLFRVAGYPGPEFAVRILDEEGNALYDAPLGADIPVSELYPEWKEIGAVINSTGNSELVIEFFSQGEATIGNDFAIDDIGLREVVLPDFDLVKTESQSTAHIGETITYTATLSNTCSQPLQNVRFIDYIPAGLELVPGSVTVNGIPSPAANPLVGFIVPDITGGSTLHISFQARVTAVPAANPAVNQAFLQYIYTPIPDGIPDLYRLFSNTVALLIEAPAALADLAVTKTALNGSARLCDTVIFMITVTNNGPDAAQAVVLNDTVPCGLTRPLYSTDNGLTWSPWNGSYTLGVLESGRVASVWIKATVGRGACGSVRNTASVVSATPDPVPDNNSATAWVCIEPVVVCGGECHCSCGCRHSGCMHQGMQPAASAPAAAPPVAQAVTEVKRNCACRCNKRR